MDMMNPGGAADTWTDYDDDELAAWASFEAHVEAALAVIR